MASAPTASKPAAGGSGTFRGGEGEGIRTCPPRRDRVVTETTPGRRLDGVAARAGAAPAVGGSSMTRLNAADAGCQRAAADAGPVGAKIPPRRNSRFGITQWQVCVWQPVGSG